MHSWRALGGLVGCVSREALPIYVNFGYVLVGVLY